jgi:hypothetical protein
MAVLAEAGSLSPSKREVVAGSLGRGAQRGRVVFPGPAGDGTAPVHEVAGSIAAEQHERSFRETPQVTTGACAACTVYAACTGDAGDAESSACACAGDA